MKLPIIVREDSNNLYIFKQVEDACSKLEAIDVHDDVYIAYDADGYRLNLSGEVDIKTYDVGFLGKIPGLEKQQLQMIKNGSVVITENDDKVSYANELIALLVQYLERFDADLDSSRSSDLGYLVDEIVKIEGYTV